MDWIPDAMDQAQAEHGLAEEWYRGSNTNRREANMGRYVSESSNSGSFTPAPSGTHIARCFSIIDMGTHHGEYQGVPQVKNEVMIKWELPEELMENGQPFIVSRWYTNSMNEKSNLRKDLLAWRGRDFTDEERKEFDLENIIGAACLLTIGHKKKSDGSVRANVISVTKLGKNMSCPPAVNPRFSFWIDEWDQAKFETLSEKMQQIIRTSDEYLRRSLPHGGRTDGGEEFRDDVPWQTDDYSLVPF